MLARDFNPIMGAERTLLSRTAYTISAARHDWPLS